MICEMSRDRWVFTMAPVIVRDYGQAVLIARCRKSSITARMFSQSVKDLDDGSGFVVGVGLPAADRDAASVVSQ